MTMRRIVILMAVLAIGTVVGMAQKVTIRAVDRPAAEVFRSIVEQTGKNFVYSSDLLEGMRVSVDVSRKPLRQALNVMFRGTGIEYKIKGRNIILTRKVQAKEIAKPKAGNLTAMAPGTRAEVPTVLQEVVVTSRLEAPAVQTAEIGAKKLTAEEIRKVPVMFGENDVIKALQMQPGISGGGEGLADMHVHGGNADENMLMLDNVPLYQANHFAGLFSAFNVEAIRYIDFFKSSIPAKYDGRLSSFLDVRTKSGSLQRHHGSFRLGLTSGALDISGPIGRKTTYMVALRRSWYEVLTVPIFALVNYDSTTGKENYQFAFMDLNAKITHRFNDRATGFASIYFGDDFVLSTYKDKFNAVNYDLKNENGKFTMHWGNIVGQLGFNYRLNAALAAEFTASYTRFFSGQRRYVHEIYATAEEPTESKFNMKTKNHIDDFIFRGDFDWQPNESNRVRFGAGYTLHRFLPQRTLRTKIANETSVVLRDSTWTYTVNEVNMYIEDDWRINDHFRLNAGIHGSLFNISGKTHYGIGPRLSLSYNPADNWAVKASYSRTTQYVHQLCETYLSLPTDQWVPITGKMKPQTADKVSVGGYWQMQDGMYAVSLEGYYKYMRNLVDYRDEYYLISPVDMWNRRLCSGKGTAKGIDFKIEKTTGKITGHIAYSLAWADRTFPDKNGGVTFPARFDNRHTIKVQLNWNVSRKVQLGATWTGHSGNRFTFMSQVWESPNFKHYWYTNVIPLKTKINNYQLPFYHRLDLSCTVRNRRGYWNFSLYNAYCKMNTVAIVNGYDKKDRPVYKKFGFLPIIPSISYTWQF